MLASYLDSTNLRADATESDIKILCTEAVRYNMAAVCINPYRLHVAGTLVKSTGVSLCTVIGFPLGADLTQTKLRAARHALAEGAQELDLVVNIGAIKDNYFQHVEQEIREILKFKDEYSYLLKVIVETALLDKQELQAATAIVSASGAEFIKTSTGFANRGVSLEDIETITSCKDEKLKIKASGGIKTLDFALELIGAGVDRIGSSNASVIMEEYRHRRKPVGHKEK